MLNIPNEIKALFKNGSAFKNFHVHFPNGENADLNNDDIVAESVQFTESICSKEVFQFGLSERSQIEFECVGVQNIFGMTIECAIEICLELLEDESQFIADHPNTGNESFLDPQICTYNGRNMYRVPYGRFIIESCPRSQGAMKHRKVTAYSLSGYFSKNVSPVLNAKLRTATYNAQLHKDTATMIQNAFLLIAGETGNTSDGTYETSDVTPGTTYHNVRTYDRTYATSLGNIRLLAKTNDIIANVDGINDVYHLTYQKNSIEYALNTIISKLEELDTPESIISYFVEVVRGFEYPMFHPNASTVGTGEGYSGKITEQDAWIYGYYPSTFTAGDPLLFLPVSIDFQVYRNGTIVQGYTASCGSNYKVYQWRQTNATLNSLRIGLEPTSTKDDNGVERFSYVDSVDVYELGRGIAELLGSFARIKRDGGANYLHLTNSAPITMTPAEYSELWWDEYTIENVGSIQIEYYDFTAESDQKIIYSIDSTGTSMYDMTDNYLLKNIYLTNDDLNGGTVYDFIVNLIETLFVPHLGSVLFTPVTLDALGLPYLESGDYLEIDDADGGTVGTYILSRTLSGIQTLTDSIESKGGEVLGNG